MKKKRRRENVCGEKEDEDRKGGGDGKQGRERNRRLVDRETEECCKERQWETVEREMGDMTVEKVNREKEEGRKAERQKGEDRGVKEME